jgi:hypothetical protein
MGYGVTSLVVCAVLMFWYHETEWALMTAVAGIILAMVLTIGTFDRRTA